MRSVRGGTEQCPSFEGETAGESLLSVYPSNVLRLTVILPRPRTLPSVARGVVLHDSSHNFPFDFQSLILRITHDRFNTSLFESGNPRPGTQEIPDSGELELVLAWYCAQGRTRVQPFILQIGPRSGGPVSRTEVSRHAE